MRFRELERIILDDGWVLSDIISTNILQSQGK